jgi:hypothetical protein
VLLVKSAELKNKKFSIIKINYEKIKTFTITSSNDDGKRDLIIVKGTWETKANNYFYLVLKMEMKLSLKDWNIRTKV